jgi:hypothetical protein
MSAPGGVVVHVRDRQVGVDGLGERFVHDDRVCGLHVLVDELLGGLEVDRVVGLALGACPEDRGVAGGAVARRAAPGVAGVVVEAGRAGGEHEGCYRRRGQADRGPWMVDSHEGSPSSGRRCP